jgi:hypothetical protein
MLRELFIALAYMPLRLLVLWGGAVFVRHDLREERRRGGPEEVAAPEPAEPRRYAAKGGPHCLGFGADGDGCALEPHHRGECIGLWAALDSEERFAPPVAEMAVEAGDDEDDTPPVLPPNAERFKDPAFRAAFNGPVPVLHLADKLGLLCGVFYVDANNRGERYVFARSEWDGYPLRCPKCVEALAIGDDLAVTGNAEGASAAWRKAGLPS